MDLSDPFEVAAVIVVSIATGLVMWFAREKPKQ